MDDRYPLVILGTHKEARKEGWKEGRGPLGWVEGWPGLVASSGWMVGLVLLPPPWPACHKSTWPNTWTTQHCKPPATLLPPSVPAPPFRYYRTANSLSGSLARSLKRGDGKGGRRGGGGSRRPKCCWCRGRCSGPYPFCSNCSLPCDAGGMLCGLLGIIVRVRISILKRLLDSENPPKDPLVWEAG